MVLHLLKTYGYLGVFASLMLGMFGLPVPDETILTLTGFLISKNYLGAAPSAAAAFLGSVCGITLNYTVGRTVGLRLLTRYGHLLRIDEARLEQVHHWFGRYGKWTLTLGYFFPGLRHLAPFVAGASKLELWVFAPFTYSGGLLWSLTFITLGYYLGEESPKLVPQIQNYLWLALGLILAFVCLYFFLKQQWSREP